MPRTWIIVLALALVFSIEGLSNADHRIGLNRGAIAWNDYGHGPSGHHFQQHHHHTRDFAWSRSPFRGYGAYRPYFNNWSGNVFLSVGNPYGFSSFGYYQGPFYGGLTFPYVYDYGYYGTYYNPGANYVEYFLPPVYQPAELAYGPLAMNQFLGLDRNFGLGGFRTEALRVEPEAARDAAIPGPVVKEIDWEARKKADRFIELGDQHFAAQKFHDALLRYRMAVKAEPNYAVAHVRHGFSLVANRRYDEAATALVKAFTIDPQILKSGFRIDLLYADNRMAREGHEEGLAMAALEAPHSGELHFVLGMWLVFGGDPERSRKFFERARELGMDSRSVDVASEGARDL